MTFIIAKFCYRIGQMSLGILKVQNLYMYTTNCMVFEHLHCTARVWFKPVSMVYLPEKGIDRVKPRSNIWAIKLNLTFEACVSAEEDKSLAT